MQNENEVNPKIVATDGADGNGGGSEGAANSPLNLTNVPMSEKGVVALGIYLFLMVGVSTVFLWLLFSADTSAEYSEGGQNGRVISNCNAGRFSNANVNANQCANCNTAANNSNVNSNQNTNANANANTNTNTANTAVNANANVRTNVNTNASPTATKTPVKEDNPAKTPEPKNTNAPVQNTNQNTNTAKPFQQNLPEITVPPYVCAEVFGLLNADAFVFTIVFFAGMLGALIRIIYSFTNHLGLNDFSYRWTWYYLLLPFFGGALSLSIYFVLRGGFYGASFGKGLILNIYAFAAFSALTGLFTGNALEKLKEVADVVLTKVPPKVEHAKKIVEDEKKNKGE